MNTERRSGTNGLRAYLDLIRVFLTPSAPADSLAGYALAASLFGASMDAVRLTSLLAVSVLLYWFGMSTNDLFDRSKDRHAAPGRPLPSGRIQLGQAVVFSSSLAALASTLAWRAGVLWPALAVLALALAYNAGGKRIPVAGSLLMGSCRAGNFLLGATGAADLESVLVDPRILAAGGMLGFYVTVLTAVSVLEDRELRPRIFHALASLLLALPLAMGALHPLSVPVWLNSIVLLWMLIRIQRRAGSHRGPVHPAAVFVRGALGGIYLVDAGLVWTFSAPSSFSLGASVAIYLLAVSGWSWKRHWLQSGGQDT